MGPKVMHYKEKVNTKIGSTNKIRFVVFFVQEVLFPSYFVLQVQAATAPLLYMYH